MRYHGGVELRHLRYFVAVAEEGHFGRAAERLRMSQPPLSRQIQDLEKQLGVQLFERGRRGAQPTEAARLLLPEARASLTHAERVERMAKRAGRGELGSLTVGFVGSATYTAVPNILREFRERFPEVELTLKEMTSTEQARALNDGLIGVGFLRPPVGGEGDYLGVRVILEEPLVAALPDSHRLSSAENVRLGGLSGDSFVLFTRRLGMSFYDLAVGACRGAGFDPIVGQEAVHIQTIIGLVAAGAGVSLVPASVAKLRDNGVTYKPLEDDAPLAKIAVAWRLGSPSHTVDALLRVAEEANCALSNQDYAFG